MEMRLSHRKLRVAQGGGVLWGIQFLTFFIPFFFNFFKIEHKTWIMLDCFRAP